MEDELDEGEKANPKLCVQVLPESIGIWRVFLQVELLDGDGLQDYWPSSLDGKARPCRSKRRDRPNARPTTQALTYHKITVLDSSQFIKVFGYRVVCLSYEIPRA